MINQHIFDSVKASLERLQLDYIDVLQCKICNTFLDHRRNHILTGHRFDPNTPIADTVGSPRIRISKMLIMPIDGGSP